MPETTIAWTRYTFNPWVGCERVSEECTNCYADAGSRRLGAQHALKLWDGDRYFTGDEYWKKPIAWNRAARKAGERRRVFCASFSDVFERRDDLIEPRRRLQRLILATPDLIWLLLSKRPENMREMTAELWPGPWPGNVWAGTTVGVRASFPRLDSLREVPATIRFVSAEPLLEDLSDTPLTPNGIRWLIIGGESGHRARPYDLAWVRHLIRRCRDEHIACFHKQIGSRPFDSSDPTRLVAATMRHPKGEDPDEWDQELRVREFPS